MTKIPYNKGKTLDSTLNKIQIIKEAIAKFKNKEAYIVQWGKEGAFDKLNRILYSIDKKSASKNGKSLRKVMDNHNIKF